MSMENVIETLLLGGLYEEGMKRNPSLRAVERSVRETASKAPFSTLASMFMDDGSEMAAKAMPVMFDIVKEASREELRKRFARDAGLRERFQEIVELLPTTGEKAGAT